MIIPNRQASVYCIHISAKPSPPATFIRISVYHRPLVTLTLPNSLVDFCPTWWCLIHRITSSNIYIVIWIANESVLFWSRQFNVCYRVQAARPSTLLFFIFKPVVSDVMVTFGLVFHSVIRNNNNHSHNNQSFTNVSMCMYTFASMHYHHSGLIEICWQETSNTRYSLHLITRNSSVRLIADKISRESSTLWSCWLR